MAVESNVILGPELSGGKKGREWPEELLHHACWKVEQPQETVHEPGSDERHGDRSSLQPTTASRMTRRTQCCAWIGARQGRGQLYTRSRCLH